VPTTGIAMTRLFPLSTIMTSVPTTTAAIGRLKVMSEGCACPPFREED